MRTPTRRSRQGAAGGRILRTALERVGLRLRRVADHRRQCRVGIEQHNQPALWHRGRRRLSLLAEHHCGLRAGRRLFEPAIRLVHRAEKPRIVGPFREVEIPDDIMARRTLRRRHIPYIHVSAVVKARGIATTTSFNLTVVSANRGVAVLHLIGDSIVSGTLSGTSVTDATCVEQLSTGEAVCRGPEHFKGTVAGTPGTLELLDVFRLNFNTGVTSGVSPINGGTVRAHGEIQFTGNAFAPLPYSGEIILQ